MGLIQVFQVASAGFIMSKIVEVLDEYEYSSIIKMTTYAVVGIQLIIIVTPVVLSIVTGFEAFGAAMVTILDKFQTIAKILTFGKLGG